MKEINRAYDTIKKSANKSYCDESQSATDAAKAQKSNNYSTQKSASYHSEKSQNDTSANNNATHNSAKAQNPNTGNNTKSKTFSIYIYPNYNKNKYRAYTVFSLAYIYCLNMLLNIALTKI